MLFLLLLVLPPALFAGANLIDKFLVNGEGEDSNPAPIIAIGGLFNLVAAAILTVAMIFSERLSTVGMTTLLALVANGATYIAAVWIYLHAMAKEEASRVTPWFLVIPAFGIGLAFFTLGELPSWYQTIAIVGIVLAGFALSIKDGVANKKVVGMMLVSACLLAVNDVIFAKFGRELNWTQALFADVLGKAFWGLMVLVIPRNRSGFFAGLKTKLKLQSVGEIITIIADGLLDIAKLMMPIAIVQAVASTQPIFVLIGAICLARFFPKVLSEELQGNVWLKASAIMVMVIAGSVLAITTS